MPPHLLIADSSPLQTRQVADILAREGWTVVGCVHDGVDAVALATSTHVDVVVLDLLLPGRPGLSVIGDVRARRPQAQFVVVTAITARPTVEAARAAGVRGYVLKPLAPDRLIELARRLAPASTLQLAV